MERYRQRHGDGEAAEQGQPEGVALLVEGEEAAVEGGLGRVQDRDHEEEGDGPEEAGGVVSLHGRGELLRGEHLRLDDEEGDYGERD